MPQGEFIARNFLLLSTVSVLLGVLFLATGHDRLPGIELGFNIKALTHIGTALTLLAGIVLMWRAEHSD